DFAYLDGSSSDRKEQVERFNKDPKLKIFLISIKAGGLGLNLTEADYVFILDPWWNPAVEAQAVDRAHRIGQKKKVFTYKFITRNTVEEKILELQQRKLKLTTDLITTEESIMKQLTREDIVQMLS
ncbi:MAG: DEAD/DEAH box helicase, partial [Cytophagia bacterium]|nr:DEAD/DEAH box helicase [Cytophagia bacterium]